MKVSEKKIPISVELTKDEQQFLINFSNLLYSCIAEFVDNYYDEDAYLRDYFDDIVNVCKKNQMSENPHKNLTYEIN